MQVVALDWREASAGPIQTTLNRANPSQGCLFKVPKDRCCESKERVWTQPSPRSTLASFERDGMECCWQGLRRDAVRFQGGEHPAEPRRVGITAGQRHPNLARYHANLRADLEQLPPDGAALRFLQLGARQGRPPQRLQ